MRMSTGDAAAWRAAHGLSQAEAARIFRVARNSWWRWEHGYAPLPPIAQVLMAALDRLWRYEPTAFRE